MEHVNTRNGRKTKGLQEMKKTEFIAFRTDSDMAEVQREAKFHCKLSNSNYEDP